MEDGSSSVVDVLMEDGTRFAIVLPTSLIGLAVSVGTGHDAATIEGDGFVARLSYGFCPGVIQDQGTLNARGSLVAPNPTGVTVCRIDQFLVLSIETDNQISDVDSEALDIIPIEIGPNYASRTFQKLSAICCRAFGPLEVGNHVVTANRFTSGQVTAWNPETLLPVWTTDVGESSVLLGGSNEFVLATTGSDMMVALGAGSGDVQWEVPVPGSIEGASHLPGTETWYVTSGFASEGPTDPPLISAIDVSEGTVMWTSQGVANTTWQVVDPAPFPDLVVGMDVPGYEPEGAQSGTAHLRAFDSRTGVKRWVADLRDQTEGHSDGLLLGDPAQGILLAATPNGFVFSVDPSTGAILWKTETGFVRIIMLDEQTVRLQKGQAVIHLDVDTGKRK